MECNIVKQDVVIEKTLLKKTLTQPQNIEFSLPDYCPDIGRILKVCPRTAIGQKLINADSLLIDGVIYVNLIYSDDKGCVRSFEYPQPFSDKTELSLSCDGAVTKRVEVTPVVEGVTCRADSERRVTVKFSLSLKTEVTATFLTPIITDIDTPSAQMLRAFAPTTSAVAVAEKYQMITETLSLPDGADDIRSLVRYDVKSQVLDSKAVGKKAVVKGEVIIDVMYQTAEGKKCKTVSFTLPWAQIIDVDNLNESCAVTTKSEVCSSSLRPKTNINGEIRNISAEIKIGLFLSAYCNADVPMLEDAFCTDCDVSLTYDSLDFSKVEKNIKDTLRLQKTLDISDCDEVIDIFSTVADIRAQCMEENLVITGSLLVTVIASNDDEINCFERNLDFEYKTSYKCLTDGYKINCVGAVISCEGKATSSGVEVRCEVSISADIIGILSKKVITAVAFGEKEKTKSSQFVACMAKEGTPLFEIAKRYSAQMEDLKRVNNLNCDCLEKDQMLIIV